MVASKPRILVVEDDAGIRKMLADRLTQYELAFASCQSDCYDQLRSPAFDLILLDLRLPKTQGDMKPTNDVGVDILSQIRKRRLTKRGSAMPMPVVVMTAHGSEKLPVTILMDHGANDYIPKPFGLDQELEHKITRALEGTAALAPNVASANTVQLSFHPKQKTVRIETVSYQGAHHQLLCVLRDLFLRDQAAMLRLDEYKGMRAGELAADLGIAEKAVMVRVAKFRQDVARDFRTSLGRKLDKNDIIQNERGWEGYRLNPFVVRIVRWDDRG